ncbi:MAG: hypothetical protein SV487_10135, partial [Thermodesulfobacteriota bacterium]|nr:hypothetical protein [Thermodesulfobacteriota bacterium]
MSLVGIFIFSGSVQAYTIEDNTLVGKDQTLADSYYGPTDFIGDEYQLYGLDLTVNAGSLLIDIYTDF